MSTTTQYTLPEVDEILQEVRESERQYDGDLRIASRTEAVLPVEVFADGELECFSFTKNVSATGVYLISPQPFFDGEQTQLRLSGLRQRSPLLPATCRWTRTFGTSFWASGWQVHCGIDVDKVLSEDRELSFDQRDSDRERLAIPVMVHPKNGSKMHCFSRNFGPQGVCLIGQQRPKVNEFYLLEIVRSNGARDSLVAQCKWDFKVGNAFWISGWQFPNDQGVAQAQMQYFEL